MPRPPKAPKGGGLHKVTVLLSADDLRAIDAEAERLTATDTLQRVVTRTDVVKLWLRMGRDASGRGKR